jgi:hypothetical protein
MVLLLLLASLMVFAITIVAIVGLLLAYRQPPEPQRFDDLSDWERVKSMSDAEIEANALSDTGALPFDDDWEFADRN